MDLGQATGILTILTGHCQLRRHLCTLRVCSTSFCRGCQLEDKTTNASHCRLREIAYWETNSWIRPPFRIFLSEMSWLAPKRLIGWPIDDLTVISGKVVQLTYCGLSVVVELSISRTPYTRYCMCGYRVFVIRNIFSHPHLSKNWFFYILLPTPFTFPSISFL